MQRPETGAITALAPGLRMVLAPNAGPMTHWGTNTFLIGESDIAVIDPGPESEPHLKALLRASGSGRITHILVTHAHADHSPLARRLSHVTGAPVLAYGRPEAGRRAIMERLARAGLAGGGEGVDLDFAPDIEIRAGARIEGAGWTFEALHTPGHFAGHLAFRWGDYLFSGDHVMDWSSSLVSPPDGDIAAFMETTRMLRNLDVARFYPAHGGALDDPASRLDWLISHRMKRETAILHALDGSPQSIDALTARIYSETPAPMIPAARRNVFAHLIDLVERNMAVAEPQLAPDAGFRRP